MAKEGADENIEQQAKMILWILVDPPGGYAKIFLLPFRLLNSAGCGRSNKADLGHGIKYLGVYPGVCS
ncbi:hypothetical protein K8S19_12625 [bacterium]|nr:hypothetical protein [bacterium]